MLSSVHSRSVKKRGKLTHLPSLMQAVRPPGEFKKQGRPFLSPLLSDAYGATGR